MRRPFLAAAGVIVLAFTVALAASGCGGTKTTHRLLTQDDLVSVIGPPPDLPAGADYSSGEPTDLGPIDLRARAQSASDRTTATLLERAGLIRVYQISYNGAINIADATAYLFKTETGAGTALTELHAALGRQTAPGQKLAVASTDGLGDGAWGAHLTGSSEAALFLFRASNLVVVSDMSCNAACGVDIVAAARAHADGIAQRASEVGR